MIYAIQGAYGGAVKIGSTRNHDTLAGRIATLQTGNAQQLVQRRTSFPEGASEGDIHHLLRAYRMQGEWFAPTGLVTVYVPGALPWPNRLLERHEDLIGHWLSFIDMHRAGRDGIRIPDVIDRLIEASRAEEWRRWHAQAAELVPHLGGA